jgi:hypothetical protein
MEEGRGAHFEGGGMGKAMSEAIFQTPEGVCTHSMIMRNGFGVPDRPAYATEISTGT